MKQKLLSLATLVLTACALNAQGNYEAIISATPSSTNSGGLVLAGTIGWSFKPTEPIQVTSVGCLSDVVNGWGTTKVGVWNALGILLASNSITSASALTNQTLYGLVPPVILEQDQTYHIGAFFAGGSTSLSLVGGDQGGAFTSASQIGVIGLVQGLGDFAFPGQSPLGSAGVLPLGPNFTFLRTVPEPSTCVLTGLGLLGLALCRRGRG